MKTLNVNNEINDSCFGVVDSPSNRFNAFDGITDEETYNTINNGKLMSKDDFSEDEQTAWNTIFDNYASLEAQECYTGLSISDDEEGNRYYYLIW